MNILNRIGYIVLAYAAALAACRGSSAAPEKHAPVPAPAAAMPAPDMTMDARTPLPLTAMMANHQKQEMRDHLRAVQEITTALASDDFEAIAKSVARIGWSKHEAMMCKHMGAGAPGFAALGEHFHKTADTIAEAAEHHDRAGVAAALGATLQACVGCHDTYRQEIVDDAAFTQLAGSAGMGASCPMMQAR